MYRRFNLFRNIFSSLKSSRVSIQTMSVKKPAAVQPKRYFINEMKDYEDGNVDICEQHWKMQIFQMVNNIEDKTSASVKEADGGLYVGIGGIAYMLYYLSQSHVFSDEREELLKHSLSYIKASVTYADTQRKDPSKISAFLLGSAGIYAVASVIYHASGDKSKAEQYLNKFIEAAANCKPVQFLRCGGDEYLVGRAGYLSSVLWLEKIFGKGIIPANDINDICSSMIQSGRKYSHRFRSPCPLMYSYYEVEYLGAAHGLSTILQMLISFPSFLKSDPSIENDVKASVDFLLNLQTQGGNFPCAMDEVGSSRRSESDELVHWCHGAPGVVYLMAKAYLLWKEEKYLKSCLKCGDLVWNKGLLRKGPGICHGVAGNGYVFLLLYRLTNDPKYLYRAHAFAEFMLTPEFKQGSRTPDSPYSLYEGLAGTVCYLIDLLKPNEAAFPFLDVF